MPANTGMLRQRCWPRGRNHPQPAGFILHTNTFAGPPALQLATAHVGFIGFASGAAEPCRADQARETWDPAEVDTETRGGHGGWRSLN